MKYRAGDVVQGVITGIKPYGAFVRVDDLYDGLIHISEINDGYVGDVHQFVRQGEKVVVKILDITDGRMRLSLKAIQPVRRHKVPIKMIVSKTRYTIGFSSLKKKLTEWIKEEMS